MCKYICKIVNIYIYMYIFIYRLCQEKEAGNSLVTFFILKHVCIYVYIYIYIDINVCIYI